MYIRCGGAATKAMLEQIEDSLFRFEHYRKTSIEFTIKVCVNTSGMRASHIDNLFATLFRVFIAMKQVNDWVGIRLMLIFEGVQKLDTNMKEVKELLKELDAIKDDYLIEHGVTKPESKALSHSYRIVISNNNCRINGYSLYNSFRSTSFI